MGRAVGRRKGLKKRMEQHVTHPGVQEARSCNILKYLEILRSRGGACKKHFSNDKSSILALPIYNKFRRISASLFGKLDYPSLVILLLLSAMRHVWWHKLRKDKKSLCFSHAHNLIHDLSLCGCYKALDFMAMHKILYRWSNA